MNEKDRRPWTGSSFSRRGFLRSLGVAGLVAARTPGALFASAAGDDSPQLYYIDGYHGGSVGHMPIGCWRDIVEAMRALPEWKLSLDVEAPSWEALHREDPDAFARVRDYVEDRDGKGRMEIVGGTFAQPYGWAIGGESNIRQLQYGLRRIHEQFPGVRVETYAVQEPCWASCLPQILRSLGFTGASLKNASTAWCGYTQGKDAELVNWIGPDGTGIPAAPRYACEDLLAVWETEATEVSPAYARKCIAHGISEPVGMCFQDLGWAAQPRAQAPWIRYATWREYIHSIARQRPVDWAFSMEDILTALPWGEKTLHRIAQQVRTAEVRLVVAEKCAALAQLKSGAAWPAEELEGAWEKTMWAQAHDAWVTATTRSGEQAWSFQVAAGTMEATATAHTLIDAAMQRLGKEKGRPENASSQYLRAVNVLGHDRNELVQIAVTADRGTHGFKVTDSDGNRIPCQYAATRIYRQLSQAAGIHDPVFPGSGAGQGADSAMNTATLLFRGAVPAFGWNTYKVEATKAPIEEKSDSGVRATVESDGNVVVESDLYRLRFDAHRGGGIASLYGKALGQEFCEPGKLLNEFRGFFIEQNRWRSSAEGAAHIEVIEAGPLRVKVLIRGEVGGCPFRCEATVVQGQPRIDFASSFHFGEDTWIGDPWDIQPANRMKERRRSSNHGRYKLQALFPAALGEVAIFKNSAFDVCHSRNASTNFERWDEIKHNIVTNWVDAYSSEQDRGMAVFSDRTTAYSCGDGDPLGLVLGWGWEAGFWWGRCPLRGEQESLYSLIPHCGRWTDAELWRQNAAKEEPIEARWMETAPSETSSFSYVRVSPASMILSAAYMNGPDLEVRVFHADDRPGACRLQFGFEAAAAHLVELDGRIAEALPLRVEGRGGYTVSFAMPKFGIRTVRVAPGKARGVPEPAPRGSAQP